MSSTLAIAVPAPSMHKTTSRRPKAVANRRNPYIQPASPELLREIGEAAYGPQWYSPMARALSAHHPDGGDLHAVVVRNWAMGARSMPSWVSPALTLVGIAERDRLADFRRDMLRRMVRVDDAVGLLLDQGASWLEADPKREPAFDAAVRAWIARDDREPEPDEDDRPAPSM